MRIVLEQVMISFLAFPQLFFRLLVFGNILYSPIESHHTLLIGIPDRIGIISQPAHLAAFCDDAYFHYMWLPGKKHLNMFLKNLDILRVYQLLPEPWRACFFQCITCNASEGLGNPFRDDTSIFFHAVF